MVTGPTIQDIKPLIAEYKKLRWWQFAEKARLLDKIDEVIWENGQIINKILTNP